VAIKLAAAGHRSLAADVERSERIELASIGKAGDHPVLLVHRWVRGGRFHAAEFDWRPAVLFEVR